jgi:class 3 adenylate cyclase
VTFLFTDIEGSTPLWDAHPDVMGRALARHDEILRAALAARGGFVFATGGDGVAAAFTRARGRAGDDRRASLLIVEARTTAGELGMPKLLEEIEAFEPDLRGALGGG